MENRQRANFKIHRVKKSRNFTMVDNALLQDVRLSLKARAVMCIIISLPDSWDFSVAGLCKVAGEGKTSIRSILAELAAHGYLAMTYKKEANGRFGGGVYDFFEMPHTRPSVRAACGRQPTAHNGRPQAAPTKRDGQTHVKYGRHSHITPMNRPPGKFGKSNKSNKLRFQNYRPRQWNYQYLELMERARIFAELGRAEEAAHLRKMAEEVKKAQTVA